MSDIKGRPIIFSAPMIAAIFAGKKTQTRRLIKPAWWICLDPEDEEDRAQGLRMNPYGQPGERLWVREVWLENAFGEKIYRADLEGEETKGRGWKSPRFMPKDFARLWLEVVSVRVERLQEISHGDIQAEGAVSRWHSDPHFGRMPISAFDGKAYLHPTTLWAKGWDCINGKSSPWASNPWVWVVTFRKVQP